MWRSSQTLLQTAPLREMKALRVSWGRLSVSMERSWKEMEPDSVQNLLYVLELWVTVSTVWNERHDRYIRRKFFPMKAVQQQRRLFRDTVSPFWKPARPHWIWPCPSSLVRPHSWPCLEQEAGLETPCVSLTPSYSLSLWKWSASTAPSTSILWKQLH